ncbi:MAG TPA: glycolate oxidase subunit GlcE [Tianweitania sediminis]|nr:glycolate oxidase subunit GlcE [Tianweitania sediminis]
MTTFTPTADEDVVASVQWALAENAPLEIMGEGSKRGIGRPAQTEHAINLSALSGITLYEPEELVLSARAGTPLAKIEELLKRNRQQLAFEPMDYGPLLEQPAGRGTIGGVLAGNLAGPRRLKAGAARDHILGVSVVSGRGELFKSGGRVVKNVTGYDLSKVMAGSWGTLGVLTSLTFKVLPAPEMEATLLVRGLSEGDAAAAMALAMGSSAEVSSAAHLPEGISTPTLNVLLGSGPKTLLRLEGFGPSVAYRFDLLHRLLRDGVVIERIDDSTAVWAEIRDCAPFADNTDRPVWRVSMAPSEAYKMVAELRMHAGAAAFYDWQGGLVWLRMEAEPEAEGIRALVAHFGGGHATLVRASPSVRASTPVFQPQPPALAALSARLKEQFDPNGILNPGRMG